MNFPSPIDIKDRYNNRKAYFRKLIVQLGKKKTKVLDRLFHSFHDVVYNQYDCLDCANCCKTISPVLNNTDIERISSHLKMKRSDFIENYCRIDEEEDYIWNTSPCPFLLNDNYCSIYSVRPKACKNYPHTDRNNMKQILTLTEKNASVCPIVFKILEEIIKDTK